VRDTNGIIAVAGDPLIKVVGANFYGIVVQIQVRFRIAFSVDVDDLLCGIRDIEAEPGNGRAHQTLNGQYKQRRI